MKHIVIDLFTGKKKESLHVLSTSDAYVKKEGQIASLTLWHAHLGHVDYHYKNYHFLIYLKYKWCTICIVVKESIQSMRDIIQSIIFCR